ncbi:hypothetical protein JW948_02030 [bacterium]|nr:hypothetical protein [bacterium]
MRIRLVCCLIVFIAASSLAAQTSASLGMGIGHSGGIHVTPYGSHFLDLFDFGYFTEFELENLLSERNGYSFLFKYADWEKGGGFQLGATPKRARSRSYYVSVAFNYSNKVRTDNGPFTFLGPIISYGLEKVDWYLQEQNVDSPAGQDRFDLFTLGFRAAKGSNFEKLTLKFSMEILCDFAISKNRNIKYETGIDDLNPEKSKYRTGLYGHFGISLGLLI